MKKSMISTAPIVVALAFAQALAQDPAQPPAQAPPATRPAPKLTLIDSIKRYLQQVGATVDQTKSTADMVVSNYADPRGGGKTTIVIVNDRRKSLLGFYVYNFGSLKNATNREDVYKFLLGANDAITIGSFFVDNEEDIGYKYMMSTAQPLNRNAFSTIYLTMAAVARDRRGEIRQILGKEREP